jgi:hypothetical protein
MLVRVAIAVLLLLLPTAARAQARKRIALLVGNQASQHDDWTLKNPHADIALIASRAALARLYRDRSKDAVTRRSTRHQTAHQTVRGEGEGTISFIYYWGMAPLIPIPRSII